jgi:hypothetical protein
MDTSVFTKVTEPAQSTMPESAKEEVNGFVIEQLFPNGVPKLTALDNTIIVVMAATSGIEDKLIRDWAYSIYVKAVKDTSAALIGAAKLVKLHQNTPQ